MISLRRPVWMSGVSHLLHIPAAFDDFHDENNFGFLSRRYHFCSALLSFYNIRTAFHRAFAHLAVSHLLSNVQTER